jgi:hypothetical protein
MNNRTLLDSIVVTASSSPDGFLSKNEQLSAMRSRSVVQFLHDRFSQAKRVPIRIHDAPILWDNVVWLSQSDSHLPYKEEVLSVLADSNLSPLQKQSRLRTMRKGIPYEYIAHTYLPNLRYVLLRFYFTEAPQPESSTQELSQTPEATQALKRGEVSTVSAAVVPEPVPMPVPEQQTQNKWRATTNLLYWAGLAPNAGIEYVLDDHYYLSLSGAGAWWSKRSDQKIYCWMDGELALNYSFDPTRGLSGPQVGAYVQTGLFEFMNGLKNRKGEFVSVGVSGGYRWQLNRRLALNAEIGLGYMYIDYKYATPMDGLLIYQGHNYQHYFGPTRAAVSLIFSFNGIK